MEGKVTYEVEHTPTYGGITVTIDFDHINDFGQGPRDMESVLKELVEFWSGYKARLNDNKGDYIKTFLKSLCQRCITVAVDNNYNENGVKTSFFNEEGWLPLDGSCGIELTGFDMPSLDDQDDYEIKELPF